MINLQNLLANNEILAQKEYLSKKLQLIRSSKTFQTSKQRTLREQGNSPTKSKSSSRHEDETGPGRFIAS